MSGSAIVMMIIAMLTVWGGLAASAVSLFRHPEQD
ncbi:methionine/alanine import family NSS transporter small subunit [Cutibacterium sp. V947]